MGHEPLMLPLFEPLHDCEKAFAALADTDGSVAVTSAEAIRAITGRAGDLAPTSTARFTPSATPPPRRQERPASPPSPPRQATAPTSRP
jgi:hypothetical protein